MASLNPNLKSFWIDENGLRKSRHRVLYGGRASSKSWEFCGRIAHIGSAYKTKVLCVRRFQNKIKESVYTLIKNQIENFELGGYTSLANAIINENGTEFSFYGIERNIDEIKSFEGADILYIEEAHNLTKEQWQILEPTIRKQGSEIWISFNPRMVTDFVYERFVINPPPNTISRLINYNENQFISSTMIEAIEALKAEDEDEYNHVYMGVPNSDDDASVIKRSWIEACIDAHIKLDVDITGTNNVGYDVADCGADRNCSVLFDGAIAVKLDVWKAGEDELDISSLRAYKICDKVDKFTYDSIGVGAGVGAILKGAGKDNYSKFNAGGDIFNPDLEYSPSITNKEKFENLKAQAWWDVADRMRNTYNAVNRGMTFKPDELISISSEIGSIEALKSELSAPHKDYSKRGKDMVESKKEVKKRIEKSHDLADAFIMAACPHLAHTAKLERPKMRMW